MLKGKARRILQDLIDFIDHSLEKLRFLLSSNEVIFKDRNFSFIFIDLLHASLQLHREFLFICR